MRKGRIPAPAAGRHREFLARVSLVFALLLPAGAALASESAQVSVPEITLQNLGSGEDAEQSADRLIRELRELAGVDGAATGPLPNAALGGRDNPLLILHVGEAIPRELKWVLLKLDAAEIRFDAKLVTPAEIDAEVAAAAEQGAPEFLQELRYAAGAEQSSSFLSDWARSEGTSSGSERLGFAQKVRLKIRQTLGLAHGLTYWAHVPRTEQIRKFDFDKGLQSGGIAAFNVSVATYLHHMGGDAMSAAAIGEMVRSAGTIGVWVFANMYHFRAMHEVMSQGKTLSEPDASGRVKVVASTPFFWTTNYLRSMLSNAFIKVSASGSDALAWDVFWRSHWNSFAGVFARSKIDKWISDRTPTRRDAEGNLVVLPGQWSAEVAGRVNFWWNNVYGFLKNLQFLGLEGAAGTTIDLLYYGLMAFNVSWTAYDAGVFGRIAAAARRAWIPEVANAPRTACATLLMGRADPTLPRFESKEGTQ